jgi:hypothetical protein
MDCDGFAQGIAGRGARTRPRPAVCRPAMPWANPSQYYSVHSWFRHFFLLTFGTSGLDPLLTPHHLSSVWIGKRPGLQALAAPYVSRSGKLVVALDSIVILGYEFRGTLARIVLSRDSGESCVDVFCALMMFAWHSSQSQDWLSCYPLSMSTVSVGLILKVRVYYLKWRLRILSSRRSSITPNVCIAKFITSYISVVFIFYHKGKS